MELSWKDAIIRVLRESDTPLHYREITEKIISQGYYASDGATPAATVSALISTSINNDGDASPFIKVGRGIFALKQKIQDDVNEEQNAAPEMENVSIGELKEANVEASVSIIQSFGMYWKRDWVDWRKTPKIYGKQLADSKAVDFGKQKGIYILYDHHAVVYVGRSIDRPLGVRLNEHTSDRLSGRWNQFSWFGLLGVEDDGSLRDAPLNSNLAALVATLEALLIEALEPPQNRRRGDDFSAIEYIQDIDPDFLRRRI